MDILERNSHLSDTCLHHFNRNGIWSAEDIWNDDKLTCLFVYNENLTSFQKLSILLNGINKFMFYISEWDR